MHALGLEFGSAARLSKGRVVCGNALQRSHGIIHKSRVPYRCPGFLSSATWPSLPKKHYNGLNQTKPKPCLKCLQSLAGHVAIKSFSAKKRTATDKPSPFIIIAISVNVLYSSTEHDLLPVFMLTDFSVYSRQALIKTFDANYTTVSC